MDGIGDNRGNKVGHEFDGCGNIILASLLCVCLKVSKTKT